MGKLETQDPHAGLQAKDTKTRSAAARDLARIGGWDDLPTLLELSLGDKSSAVRLYTAAAAADIVFRQIGADGQASLDDDQRAALHGWVRRIDPGQNPSLLMLLAAAADRAAYDKLGRMLRDPRSGVRAGAAMAVRRLALSGVMIGRDELPEAAAGWLASRKLPPDAILELVRLAGDAGWSSMSAEVRRASTAGRPHVEAVDEALGRLEQRASAGAWTGVWRSDGLDVMEVALEPRHDDWMVVESAVAHRSTGAASLAPAAGGATVGGEPARLIWAQRLGTAERVPAIQIAGRTWWGVSARDAAGEVEGLIAQLDPAGAAAAERVLAAQGEGVVVARARGILSWRAGELDAAAEALAPLAEGKRPRADILYWLARVYASQGNAEAAVPLLETFLERAARKAVQRDDAEALLSSLRGA